MVILIESNVPSGMCRLLSFQTSNSHQLTLKSLPNQNNSPLPPRLRRRRNRQHRHVRNHDRNDRSDNRNLPPRDPQNRQPDDLQQILRNLLARPLLRQLPVLEQQEPFQHSRDREQGHVGSQHGAVACRVADRAAPGLLGRAQYTYGEHAEDDNVSGAELYLRYLRRSPDEASTRDCVPGRGLGWMWRC
jgi:hypothetical protein